MTEGFFVAFGRLVSGLRDVFIVAIVAFGRVASGVTLSIRAARPGALSVQLPAYAVCFEIDPAVLRIGALCRPSTSCTLGFPFGRWRSTHRKPLLGEVGTRECPVAQNRRVESAAFGYRVAPEAISLGILQYDSLGGGSYH